MRKAGKHYCPAIIVPIAVVFEDGQFLHSAMLSGNSLWSVGQRAHHAKNKGKKLTGEMTTLHISGIMARRIAKLIGYVVKE